MTTKRKAVCGLGVLLFLAMSTLSAYGTGVPLPYDIETSPTDTIPLKDRHGDYINDGSYNPFDIMPTEIEQTVEYDAEKDRYVILEKIGDEYYRTPTYMTFEEYLEWRAKKQEREYFESLAGFKRYDRSKRGIIDPISKVDIGASLIDRLFGGNDITIEPQGNIDLDFGWEYQRIQNPNIPVRQQTVAGPLFDMNIKMNVDGNIGDKLNLGFNYDTQASFDFDRKIKLAYDSEQFSEDDIIKKVEAGNVSLPLRSSLIQGAQSLFGLKTELQFGNLRITGIASQQRSQKESLSVQNGSSVQEFEIRPDEYDENRHFFISHYHRQNFERALSNLPYINSNFRINNIEIWISDDRTDYQQNTTMIAAISDIAEPHDSLYSNRNPTTYQPTVPLPPEYIDINGLLLPENNVNTLFEQLLLDEDAQRVENTATILKGKYNLDQPRDFEVFRGRKLSPGEYSFNEQLGFISLNIRLRPNQVLGVAYEYFYTLNCDDVYKVGKITDESLLPNSNDQGEVESEAVIFVKMLKSSNQIVNHPTWDLMMKNVYPLRTSQLDQTDFQFDVFYEDDRDGTLKKFLPEENFPKIPLLNVFGLDRLNSRNDPQPDGIFDFVPGITVVPQSSSIVFPVLEPFGSSMDEIFGDPAIAEKYKFQELYDTTVFAAQQFLEKNKFVMAGKVKSNISSEISLGAWNIPQGSVTVRAGSQILVEGQDYEVDYGIGRVRIINQSYLQQGVPINVSYEDNSVFSLQQKTMLGLRADYEVNDNLNIGATYMRLFERPFTEKVNIGDDPINNRIFGLDMDYSNEMPFLTNMVDKLPFYSTSAPSSLNFTAEVAALKPGHSRAVNLSGDNKGVVSIDDFEGAINGLPLSSQPNRWILASTPQMDDFPESVTNDDIAFGANRARLNWYVIDRSARQGNTGNSYTRLINQQELFQRDLPPGQLPDLFTFDLSYYPDERGPYNFDPPGGTLYSAGIDRIDQTEQRVVLAEPETRWAGIMRYMTNNDFQAANYEFIDFWLLNPFMERPDGTGHSLDEDGYITFHLGNVSEDIMRDNLQFFENNIPVGGEVVPTRETSWGIVPLDIPTNDAFARDNIDEQDLGYDGLNDNGERLKFQNYIDDLVANFGTAGDVFDDPSADNFVFFNNDSVYSSNDNLLKRYSKFNNPEGNAPDGDANERGNPFPDKEDLNNNRSLDLGESFHQYRIRIANASGEIDTTLTPYIRETKTIINPGDNNQEKWYRFQIPLNDSEKINGIEGFRSIQFMRILVNGFETQKTFRMAEFELVRNQWRRFLTGCGSDGVPLDFSVDAVGIEENGSKTPFGYILPKGIKQERLFSTFSNILQDEKSLSINFQSLRDSCEVAIFKLTELDLRVFERMQMFVHAEAKDDLLEDGDVSIFMRIGKDFVDHYYEYEIPLTLSTLTDNPPDITDQSDIVWRPENMFDFALDALLESKKIRNVTNAEFNKIYQINQEVLDAILPNLAGQYNSISGDFTLPEGHQIRIKGTPNLARVKGIMVGLRNISEDPPPEGFRGEVWINELRATGLLERGGVAGLARLDVQLADLGNVTLAGSYSSIGWGALDQKVNERALEETIEYDVATNLELGKFLPEAWNVRVPFYAQYAKTIVNPEFDAYEMDLKVDEMLELADTEEEREDIKLRDQTVNTIKTINFTNVRKERGSGGSKLGGSKQTGTSQEAGAKPKTSKPMPWDISNFSVSYAFTEVNYRDPILSLDNTKDYKVGLDYNYALKGFDIKPFGMIKAKSLKFLSEFNISPLPNSFNFSSNVNRMISVRRFRLPVEPIFEFEDRRFDWERRYDVRWDITKAIKINFSALNKSYIDEYRQVGIAETPEQRPWLDERGKDVSQLVASDPDVVKKYWVDNLKDFGRNTNYSHQFGVNYTLPFKLIPILDWIDVKTTYRSDYKWDAGPLITIDELGNDPGAVIQNSQNRTVTANLNFDKLYGKSKYLKELDRIGKKPTRRSRTTSRSLSDNNNKDDLQSDKKEEKDRKSKDKDPSPGAFEKFLLRPLFVLRSVRINYKEDFSTVVPGFNRTPQYFGLSDQFSAPGWGFVMGLQPDLAIGDSNNWLFRAVSEDRKWITESRLLNQQVLQNKSQTFDAKIKLEPWTDFKIDVDLSKNYSQQHMEEFKNKSPDPATPEFNQLAAREVGSFEVSYFTLNTLFGQDINELFNNFETNRAVISARLPNIANPGSHTEDGNLYTRGYGKLSSQVLVPSFLAAYTNSDITTTSLDLERDVSQRSYLPKPNWKLRYDGLAKLPWFQEIFSSFSVEHGYTSTLQVNNFYSDIEYDAVDPFSILKIPSGNYFSRIEIPQVQITENFVPIIGISIKTKKDLNLDFEYKKTRQLGLSLANAELLEGLTSEYVFGFGYTLKDSKFLKKKKKSRSRSSRDRDADEAPKEDEQARDPRSRRGGRVSSQRGNDMTFSLNFSLRDDVQYRHELDKGTAADPTRGLKTLTINPSVDYVVNKNLTIRTFVDFTRTRPYLNTSYPITSIQGGVTLRMTLN